MLKRSLLLFLIIGCQADMMAQELTQNNWYFGNSMSGIRFNRGNNFPSLVTDQTTPFGTGGSAVATDRTNANLLFYSDGNNVYDACHMLMPSGTGLNANTNANQPVAISSVPRQPNKYYVFTNTGSFAAGGTISRSVVDLNLFGNAVFPSPALGDVESSNTAITKLTNRSEGMIVVPHSNKEDFWLISHEVNSQNYAATLIDSGAYTGTFNTIMTMGVGLPITVSGFSYNATLGKIAVAPQSSNINAHILNFNDTTGAFTFDRFIDNSGVTTITNQAIYDIEWSHSGRYLYLSRHGEAGINADVLQYDYNDITITLTSVLSTPIFRSYGLQMAPDSAIYHLYRATSGGPFLLGRFNDVDSVSNLVMHEPIPFDTANIGGTQFSSFLPHENVPFFVGFTSIGSCQSSPTAFFSTVTPAADSLKWNFGDGNRARGVSPIHTYTDARNYTVTLTAFFNGQMKTATQLLAINPFPLEITLVQDTTACRSEFPPPRGSSTPMQFQVTAQVSGGTPASANWSNGDVGLTLSPDSAGYYYLVVTDASGCSTYAGVNVKEYELMDQRANIWYFGNMAGIDFNPLPNPPVALDNSAMNAPEGTSTISDRNGNVIFYTDGDKVYDRTHAEIATGIGGDPASSQSALIVPVPGDETLYYIFTTQAVDGTSANQLSYSLFDLKLNGGLGGIVQKNSPLFARSTERITANGNWVIIHEYGNNTFRAYPIGPSGIGEPVISGIGTAHSFKSVQEGEGYMKLGPGGNLAVALSTPSTGNLIELFTLVDSSGLLTNYRKIDLNESNGRVYGVEFSPGGNKLFATLKGAPAPSTVYEYFLDSLGRPFLLNTTPGPNQELGALQVGPDGQIYLAINGSNVLGTIQANDDTTLVSAVNFSGFALAAGTSSGLGLPNFVQSITDAFSGPDFIFDGICFGIPTSFVGIPTDPIDELAWFFGIGQGGLAAPAPTDTTHLYTTTGTHNVVLTINNRCLVQEGRSPFTVEKPVTIVKGLDPPTIPAATALCTGPVILDANNTNLPGLSYSWSSGETTQTVTIENPAFISVTNTDANGCTSTGESIVVDNRPKVDFGSDITICEDTNTPALNALNPGANYTWVVNGTPSGTAQIHTVDTSNPGVFTYEVTVTDPVTSCNTVEDKVYNINVSPRFSVSGTDPVGCGNSTGDITLQLNTSVPPGGPYSYFINGPGGVNLQDTDQTAPNTVGPITGQRAGIFSVTVSDQISGCAVSQTLDLGDMGAAFTVAISDNNCDPTIITASTGGGSTSSFTYSFTNNATGQTFGPQTTATATFSPGDGEYVVEILDTLTGCLETGSANVVITPKPITFAEDICQNPATVTASLDPPLNTGSTYSWIALAGGNIVSGAATQIITISTSGTYQVTATTSAGCDVIDTRDIVIDLSIMPDFTQTDPCETNVTLNAVPIGSYTYRWFKNGVFQNNLLGQQISIGTADTGSLFNVALVNAINGCVYTSPQKVVNIVGPVTAALSSTTVCDDDRPFTLTATGGAMGATFKWFLDGTEIVNADAATLDQTSEGTYRVDISKDVCSSSASLQIIKLPIPVGNLPNRVIICDDPENQDSDTNQVDLDPGAFEQYDWFKNELTLNFVDQVYNANSAGLYLVEISNIFGCVSSDQTEVVNQCIPKIEAPTAFRPSSNIDANKKFSIFTFFITDEFQVFIYNRWGELVYQSNDRFFKWDGSYNNTGQPLPGGSYAYVLKYVSSFRPELGVQEKHGGVALLR